MSKTNEKPAKDTEGSPKSPPKNMDGWRETIESIVVAFILAFLFRSFEAEAFVIPTGSMAPTLRGRHKEITCEKCKFHFSIGASDEVEQPGYLKPDNLIKDVVCPNCRYITPAAIVRELPVFNGDRILVNKFPYEFGDPSRWDVLVFKYPEEPDTNYIKRLVGLPGDELQLQQGDVYSIVDRKIGILRKDDPNKQRALQILVHHNDYAPHDLLAKGWPSRWAGVERSKADGNIAGWSPSDSGWTEDAEARTFAIAEAGEHRWLRYRHFIPRVEDWQKVRDDDKPNPPRPELITDFCGYNAYTGGQMGDTIDYGQYWVGDLTINCEIHVTDVGTNPEIILELNEGARKYRCVFDLEAGTATLLHNITENAEGEKDEWTELASADTRLKASGKYDVSFANVDHRLCLWVNNSLIDFGKNDDDTLKTTYAPGGIRGYRPPTDGDLIPVGIAAKGVSATVSHLVLQRDIYYRGEHADNDNSKLPPTHEYSGGQNSDIHHNLNLLVYEPNQWWREYFGNTQPTRFAKLGDDEYFVMGDNSPRSKDSRLWPNDYRHAKNRHAVPRSKLVGKAFIIYWPHGVPFLNDGNGYPITYHRDVNGKKTDYPSFRFPFYPDFKRMRRIR